MATYGAAELAASFRTVRKNTLQIAEEIPEDKYSFQASPDTRNVAQMLVHIAVSTRIWQDFTEKALTTFEGYDFVPRFQANMAEEQLPRTKAEIVALLQSDGETFANFIAGLSDDFLAVQVTQPGGQGSKSRLESLMGAKEHEMHHRSQLMLIERLFGITPHLTRAMQERFAAMHAAKK